MNTESNNKMSKPRHPTKRLMETSAASARAKAKLQGKTWDGDKLDKVAITNHVRDLMARQAKDSSGFDQQQSGEDWEDFVFVAAEQFTATVFVGRGQYQTEEFTDPTKAMERAEQMNWNGRQGLVYAIAPSGRRACLARSDWPRYRMMWEAKFKLLGAR